MAPKGWESQVLTWGSHCDCFQILTHKGVREVSMATGARMSESLKSCSDRRMLLKRAAYLEQNCYISCQKPPDLVSTIKDLVGGLILCPALCRYASGRRQWIWASTCSVTAKFSHLMRCHLLRDGLREGFLLHISETTKSACQTQRFRMALDPKSGRT